MSIVQFFKRFGITTGAAAAAAAKAAAFFLVYKKRLESVVIPTPVGLRIEIPIEIVYPVGDMVCAHVKKFAGDNIDVLDGVTIVACVKQRDDELINVDGGKGVGVVVKSGLSIPVGKKAISPAAKEMIIAAVKEVSKTIGFDVVIEVPIGEEITKETLNELVGIINGVSILGTTGIEWPVSNEQDLYRIQIELSEIRTKYDSVVIAVGNKSYLYASKIFDPSIIVKAGDNVGFAVSEAKKKNFSQIIISSLPSKALKLAAGIFNTSSRVGDARIETLTHACVVLDLDAKIVKSIAHASSVEEAIMLLRGDASKVFKYICNKIVDKIKRIYDVKTIEVIIFDNNGNILAKAREKNGMEL